MLVTKIIKILIVLPIVFIFMGILITNLNETLSSIFLAAGAFMLVGDLVLTVIMILRPSQRDRQQSMGGANRGVVSGVPHEFLAALRIAILSWIAAVVVLALLGLYVVFDILPTYLVHGLSIPGLIDSWISLSLLISILSYVAYVVTALGFARLFKFNKDSRSIIINSDKEFFGVTIALPPPLTRKFMVISQGDYARLIEAHERAHANSRAFPLLHLSILFLFGLILIALLSVGYSTIRHLSGLLSPFFTFFTLSILSLVFVILRAIEVHADFAAYRVLGPKAHDLFMEGLKHHPFQRSWTLRLQYRLTHTGRREFALRFGDPIGAHGAWDFAISSSLFSAALTYAFLIEVPGRLHTTLSVDLLVPIALALWGSSLVVTFLLSLILRPIVFRLTRGFTDGGVSALSSLIASMYMASVAVALFLLPMTGSLSLTSLIIGALLNYALVRHYLSLVHGGSALRLTLASYIILIAISALLLTVGLALLHAHPP